MTSTGLLRDPSADKSDRVGFIELFFDLVFVFAVTQLAHRVVEMPSPRDVSESLILFLAIWSVWTGTTWVTNRLDVERNSVRLLLLLMMIGGIFQALAIPDAFKMSADAIAFALVHIALQLGRSIYVVGAFYKQDTFHFRHSLRTMVWMLTAAPFWVIGALRPDEERLFWWVTALLVEYGATAARYWVPIIGTSQAADWNVEANHFAERCGLFIIIALGELILITGNKVGDLTLNFYTLIALLSILVATMSMWWIYFSYSAEKGTKAVEKASDTGREARIVYVYLHIPVICGMLLSAAGDEGLVDHPADAAKLADAVRIVGGAALFLAGTFIVKRVICRRFITSHGTGIAALAVLGAGAVGRPLYLVNLGVAAILVLVAIWEELAIRAKRRRRDLDASAGAEEKISMVEA